MTRTAVARLDCHIHSHYSPDGRGSLREIAAVARAKGLTGFFVTDHNSLRMAKDIRETPLPGLIALPGMEVSTADGHCLALGVRGEVPRGLSLADTLETAEALGGVGVPSHPFRFTHGVGAKALGASTSGLVAVETYNARDGKRRANRRAQAWASAHALGGTGGSDAHMVFETGNAFAAFPGAVENVDDAIDQILKRRTWSQGVATPRSRIVFQNAKNVWLWARRGFRSI